MDDPHPQRGSESAPTPPSQTSTRDGGDDVARALLDGLLGATPSRVVLCGAEIALVTPRGLERVTRDGLRRRPRLELPARLLDVAPVGDDTLLLLDGDGTLWRWRAGVDRAERLGPTDVEGAARLAVGARWLAIAGTAAIELRGRDGSSAPGRPRGDVGPSAPITALAMGSDDAVLVGAGATVTALAVDGGALREQGRVSLGDEGDVLALTETAARAGRPRPGQPGPRPTVVAFDEFGWLHVIDRVEASLVSLGAVELEVDGGVPARAGMHGDGPMVTVASGTSFLHQVDLRAPGSHGDPVPMALVCVGLGLADVTMDDRRIYLADTFRGLVVLDRALFEVCHDDPELARVPLSDGPAF